MRMIGRGARAAIGAAALLALAGCADEPSVVAQLPGSETLRWSATETSLAAAQGAADAYCGGRSTPDKVYSDKAVEIARFDCH